MEGGESALAELSGGMQLVGGRDGLAVVAVRMLTFL